MTMTMYFGKARNIQGQKCRKDQKNFRGRLKLIKSNKLA